MRSLFAFVLVFIAFLAVSYASPYNKYGRTCKDILCTVREECIMQRDECTGRSDKCGTYPTCKRKPSAGKTGCAAMRCPTGHFCSIRQENCDKPPCQIKPTCIAFRTPSPNRATNVPDVTTTTTIPEAVLTTPTPTPYPEPAPTIPEAAPTTPTPTPCPEPAPTIPEAAPTTPKPTSCPEPAPITPESAPKTREPTTAIHSQCPIQETTIFPTGSYPGDRNLVQKVFRLLK